MHSGPNRGHDEGDPVHRVGEAHILLSANQPQSKEMRGVGCKVQGDSGTELAYL